jgi:hypothetical protein
MEERDLIYAKPAMTDADGMRLGRLGIVGGEDGYSAESDAAICSKAGHSDALPEAEDGKTRPGQKVRSRPQALSGIPGPALESRPTISTSSPSLAADHEQGTTGW